MAGSALRFNFENRLMYLGVALLFAPLGIMISLISRPVPTWSGGIGLGVFSGVVSMAWAYAFSTRRFWLLALIVPGSIVTPGPFFAFCARIGLFSFGESVGQTGRGATLVVMASALLSLGFICMVLFIRRKEAVMARGAAELELARGVHEALVPIVRLEAPWVRVLGISSPSAEMGGDLVDLIVRSDAHDQPVEIDAYLADVSGHGVAAGIVMGMVKSAIRTRLRQRSTLSTLIDDVNGVLSDLTQPHMFATLACVRCAPNPDGTVGVEYALAGHLPIVVVRARSAGGAGGDAGAAEEFHNDGLPLGVMPGERYAAGRATLAAGDLLAMFTDGLSETQDRAGREMGLRGVRDAIVRAAAMPTLQGVHDAVLAEVRARGRQADDQTLVLIRV